jgi:hypothetical protein
VQTPPEVPLSGGQSLVARPVSNWQGREPPVIESAFHVAALGAFLWVVGVQLPRARREQDAFAVLCSVLTGLVALTAWLFGVATH